MENAEQTMNLVTDNSFDYYAFISYQHDDKKWTRWLLKKLENYKLPRNLGKKKELPKKIRHVFWDIYELPPPINKQKIHEKLERSQYLIVICSPRSAKSEYVNDEVKTFMDLGRIDRIITIIIEGTPYSNDPDTECYPKALLELPEKIFGANVEDKGRNFAFVKVLAGLIKVAPKRLMVRNAILWIVGALVVIATMFGIWKNNQPEDFVIKLNEASIHNDSLPPLKNAVVTMTLNNETKTDTIRTLDTSVTFFNIPHRYLNKKVHFKVICRDFVDIDTLLPLGKQNFLNIYRNPNVYGEVQFILYDPEDGEDGKNLSYTWVDVDGHETYSDGNGRVSLFISMEQQKTSYPIIANFELENSKIYMPCGKNDVVEKKRKANAQYE